MNLNNDEIFMRAALNLAKLSFDEGEVPVGAVIVHDGKIIAEGRNRREHEKNAVSHAEINAINAACKALSGWRLCDCTLYVSLEPCPMCAGAVINSRLSRVVFGASDKTYGALGSLFNLTEFKGLYKPKVCGGILAEESSALLSDFFKKLRGDKNG